ncbi:hypothetical protein LSCM1_02730 [Leishmania martiniquensis]|uniref:PH-like domain-containing protein n=1 Tax=Leishmania martiniquensis TaxID=1580590 RepID=A0A836KEE6_9TRYP|nr:hypothetical protein LSCM1_02730 [Leishmania martiniquensis]
MVDSFVPRLQLSTSRNSAGRDDGLASRLNRTAAPYTASPFPNTSRRATEYDDDGYRYSLFSTLNSNNNTSLTNCTSISDWLRHSHARGRDGATAETLSPIPRISEPDMACGGGRVGARQRYAVHKLGGGGGSVGEHRDSCGSGSRGIPAPSASRPLFTTFSASLPRDKNLIVGNTGRVAWAGSKGVSGSEEAAERYSTCWPGPCSSGSTFGPVRWGQRPSVPSTLSSVCPALSRTYVGIAPDAQPTSRQEDVRRGVGLPGTGWQGARGTAESGFDWGGDTRGAGIAGLVNSRSRARVDRWTDEGPQAKEGNEGVPIGDPSEAMSSDTSSTSFEERRPRSRERRRHRHGLHHRHSGLSVRKGNGSRRDKPYHDDDVDSASKRKRAEECSLSFADAIVSAMDAQPVVPPELLRGAQERPFVWNQHPSHGVVLCLLRQRGICPSRYRELVEYHMAELFLHYVDLCREGAFFVYYARGKSPKERFFRISMLPASRRGAVTKQMPHLVIALHKSSSRMLDAIPLDDLVGVTVTPQSACFRRFLESPQTLIGCREGRGHRARLPVDGAFSLWFYNTAQHMPRSVDILTCDAKVFDIWTKTFRGLVSVNSSSVVQVALTPHGESMRLAELTRAAQQQAEA